MVKTKPTKLSLFKSLIYTVNCWIWSKHFLTVSYLCLLQIPLTKLKSSLWRSQVSRTSVCTSARRTEAAPSRSSPTTSSPAPSRAPVFLQHLEENAPALRMVVSIVLKSAERSLVKSPFQPTKLALRVRKFNLNGSKL